MTREEQIRKRKDDPNYRSRHNRRIEKFSDRFNGIFFFFLKSYRKNILTFAGSYVEVEYDKDSHSCREAFRRFDDGQFKTKPVSTRHPNIVKAVITAKKSWGLHRDMWTDGIVEGTFTKQEILNVFKIVNIELPEPFVIEFENNIYNKTMKFCESLQ